jgi:hypothetical protein
MNAVAQIVALWLQRGFALVRSVGPYALIEILLPGGTLIALLLWLARQGAFSTRAGSIELMPAHYSKRWIRRLPCEYAAGPCNEHGQVCSPSHSAAAASRVPRRSRCTPANCQV